MIHHWPGRHQPARGQHKNTMGKSHLYGVLEDEDEGAEGERDEAERQ